VRELPDDAERAHALLDAIDLVGSAPDLDETLRRTAAVACALARAAYAVVELSSEDSLVRHVEHGVPPTDADEGHTLDLLAHGVTLGRVTVRGPEVAFEDADRELFARLVALVAPLVANAVAFDESDRRRRWLEGTVKVAAALAPTMLPDDARAQLVAGVRAASGASLVALLEPDGPGDDRWHLVAHDGDEAEAIVAARVLAEEIAAAGDGGRLLAVERVPGVESLLIPLQTQLTAPGVLLVDHAGMPSGLGGLERHLLSTFAGQVSLALDRAQAIADRHELLIAADRDRIARDLHDLVIQRLYATGMQLQAALGRDGVRMEAAITLSVRDLDASIRDLRATIFELGRGLTRSLTGDARGLVEEYAAVLGFRPALRFSGPVDTALSESVADEVLLVLREALSNVARHAGASAVQVELAASPAWLMLRVTDNGVGMAAGAGVSSGLRNALRRAETHGGVMRTGSATPHGTSLVWLVPATR